MPRSGPTVSIGSRGCSPGNAEEFTFARSGEPDYRPLVERLGREAETSVENGRLPTGDDYPLPESDRAAVAEQAYAPGFLFCTRAAHLGGIDGWIDHVIAFTGEWGSTSAQSTHRCQPGMDRTTCCVRADTPTTATEPLIPPRRTRDRPLARRASDLKGRRLPQQGARAIAFAECSMRGGISAVRTHIHFEAVEPRQRVVTH